MRAASTGNQEYIESCLSGNQKSVAVVVHTKDRFGQTAAHWAAYRGQIHILKLLIAAGASMDTKDMDGRVTLHWAVRKERAACVHYLLQQGSPCDHQTKGTGETALHKAARQGNIDICQLLCVAGARRDICTSHNQTALDIAREMRKLEVEYMEKEKNEKEEEAKLWENGEGKNNGDKEPEEKAEAAPAPAPAPSSQEEQALTETQKSKKKSYPTDRPKESPYVATGKEIEEENKFGPIVELLEHFTDDMVNPKALMAEEDEEETKGKKRGRGRLKRKSTIYQDDAPMAEVFEEKLRSGSMQSGGGGKTGCSIQ
jgi:hypothetical protein